MSKLRRIDALLNEETREKFYENDIVKIQTGGTFGREYIGRIDNIGTLELQLDMSKEYKYRTEIIKYEDILSIQLVE